MAVPGRIFRAIAILLPLAVLAFLIGARFIAPTQAQRAALQLMSVPTPPVAGRDGSDAAWLLKYDVPAERQAEVAAQLRRTLAAVGAPRAQDDPPTPFRDPLAAWPKFPEQPQQWQGACAERERGCLEYVRHNMALVAATLDQHRRGLEATHGFMEHDGIRIGLPASFEMALPPLGTRRRLVLADFAHRFAGGERVLALDGLCRDLIGWRRIGGNVDHLVPSMIGVSYVRADLMLLSEMLADLPLGNPLPDSCTPALSEMADDELELCPAIRTEFRLNELVPAVVDSGQRKHPWLKPSWFFDHEHFRALAAEDKARYCAPALLRIARADQSVLPRIPLAKACPRWRKLSDPVGCLLAEAAASSNYGTYLDRRTDQAAMLALMRTVVWLRGQAASPEEVADALARRPEELGLRRTPSYETEQSRVSIPMLDRRQDSSFELSVGFGAKQRARQRFRRTGRALV